MTTYRDAGVDIDAGNRTVSLIADAVKATNTGSVLSEVGAFGGLFAADNLGSRCIGKLDGRVLNKGGKFDPVPSAKWNTPFEGVELGLLHGKLVAVLKKHDQQGKW